MVPAPLVMVKEFEKKYAGCYQLCDKLIEETKGDMNWWGKVYIPIAATNAIMEQYGARWEGNVLHALYSWRQSKQILQFDKTLLDEILDMPDPVDIPVESFDGIPYNALYIDLEESVIENFSCAGFFVTFDEEESGIRELRIMTVNPEKEAIPLYLPLQKGFTIQESLSTSRGAHELEMIMPGQMRNISKLITKFVNIILYVCCKNADIAENPVQKTYTRKPSIPKQIKDVPREIQKWDVGWRVGAQLRQNYQIVAHQKTDNEQSDYGKTGGHKRPHVRAGHYHSFWTGRKGTSDRKLIVKWMPPMQINMNVDNEIITTIRKVK